VLDEFDMVEAGVFNGAAVQSQFEQRIQSRHRLEPISRDLASLQPKQLEFL
jgi:hypothetical protein